MTAPTSILSVLEAFRPEFTPPTWARALHLILGTILARGRRTVAAALRQMGLHEAPDFSSYHHVFNRAAWSPRNLARRLLSAAIAAFVPEGVGLTFAIDETLERRWGRKIRIRGHDREPLASSKERSVSASGIRWIVLALVVTPPWASRPWALPILSLPCPTPKGSSKLGRRHKTVAERARQMIACLRRWLPGVSLTVFGDSAYSVIELGLACRRRDVGLIAPLRLDARLFTPAPERAPGTVGRPRVAGERLPNLDVVLADPKTSWSRAVVRWYDGADRALEVASGTAVWYHNGMEPLPIRWVLVRDPAGRLEPRTYFSARPEDEAATIPAEVVKRWPIEVTFEETRAHLGGEMQRQWSVLAIERETPCILRLYSVVVLLGDALHKAADRDPGGGLVSEGGGDILGRAGGGASGMLGFSGSSDIPRRPVPCGNPEVAARSPAQRDLLFPLTRKKSSSVETAHDSSRFSMRRFNASSRRGVSEANTRRTRPEMRAGRSASR